MFLRVGPAADPTHDGELAPAVHAETLAPLVVLNRELVTEALARLALPRVTIDVDGSVRRTPGGVSAG